MLAGCASIPQPKPATVYKAPVVKAAPVAPVEATPNQTVKKRWFKGYKIRLLHK
jgi:hypothetical protein